MLKSINFEKTIYALVLLFAFILPLSRALISFFIIFLPIVWLLQGNLKEKFHYIRTNKLLFALVIFIAYSAFSMLWSTHLKDALSAFRMTSYLFTIFVIATSIKKEQIPNIITAFLAGMFISEIIAYGVFFELWTFKYATVQNPSPFMIHIDYSVFLAFSSILLLNRLFSSHYTKKEKIFLFFFFFTVTGNLFLSTGRTGQVAYIAGIFVMSIIHFRFTIKSLIISTLLIGLIFSVAYNLSNSFQLRAKQAVYDIKQITNLNLNGSWGIRAAFWVTTYDSLKEHPFGSGLGDYKLATKTQVEKNDYKFINNRSKKFMIDAHPHNQYLLVILQMGIIGLFMFFYIIYQLFKLNIIDKEIKEVSTLFATIFFVSSLAEPLLMKQFTLVLFVLFVGLFSVNQQINYTKKNTTNF